MLAGHKMHTTSIKVIRPDGRIRRAIAPNDPGPCLASLQAIVGGSIKVVPLPGSRYLVIHAEGKLEHLPPNPLATKLAHGAESITTDDYIAGTAILTPKRLLL